MILSLSFVRGKGKTPGIEWVWEISKKVDSNLNNKRNYHSFDISDYNFINLSYLGELGQELQNANYKIYMQRK